MGLEIIKADDSIKWNKIVHSFKTYGVHYLCEYVRAFEHAGEGEPLLFYFEGSDTRAINVVMKRDIANDEHFSGKIECNKYFDYSTPYGYGGPIVEGPGYEDYNSAFVNYCNDNNIVCEFVRFGLFNTYKNLCCGITNGRSVGF